MTSFGPPPSTRIESVVETVHGVEIVDPYRWLEDSSSPETVDWTAAQNAHARTVLDAFPRRAPWHAELLGLLSVSTSGAPTLAGDVVFSLDRTPGQEQAVLASRPAEPPPDGTGWPGRLVFDPLDGGSDTTTTIDWYEPSPDGSLVAIGVSTGGDENSTLRVVETSSGTVRPDLIPHTRAASVAWDVDCAGFHYTRYPAAGTVPDGEEQYHRTVWHHRLGDDPADDRPVFTDLPDPTAWPTIEASPDGRWLLVHLSLGWSRTDVILLDLHDGTRRVLIEGVEALTHLAFDRDRLLGVTTLDAARGRVITARIDHPTAADWATIVPETHDVIEAVHAAGEHFLVLSSRVAVSILARHERDGRGASSLELPEIASVGSLSTDEHGRMVASITSFTRPSSLIGLAGERLVAWSEPDGKELDGKELGDLVTMQVDYPSTDGTLVPMFLVHDRSTTLGPDVPALLTAYGGFAISNGPGYSPLFAAWCRAGGVVAIANIRGGSEHGEAWHHAGMLDRKQQCFDDFYAAADWLVETRRTARAKLALRGGSNGGLLMGAAITQRPDLARAVHCAVPLLDMVRYERFLIARLWIPEYGDPADAEQFAWLHDYSPYHHVVDGTCYPAALITSGVGDSRVDPMHARKMAARLQAATSCGSSHPQLVLIEPDAGHGQGKPLTAQADELADVMSFLMAQLHDESASTRTSI